MELTSFATYVAAVVIYTIFGVVLLCSDMAKTAGDRAFNTVLRLLAVSAFIEAFKDVVTLAVMRHGVDWSVLNWFFVPVSFYLQIILVSLALLRLLHSRKVSGIILWLVVIPVPVLSVLYVAGYLLMAGFSIHLSLYMSYVTAVYARVLTYTLWTFIAMDLAVFGILLVREAGLFTRNVGNYFSGDVVRGRWMTGMLYFFVIYMSMECLDFLCSPNAVVDLVLTWTGSLMFIACNIIVLNLQNLFIASRPAFVENRTEGGGGLKEDVTAVDGNFMEGIVRTWSTREDKPFTREGLTLTETAAQMGVSPRLLSSYVNDVFDMNFNTWINNLRIGEIKRLMAEKPELTIVELAEMTGFTDAPAMSRTFKKLQGVTPTQYRAELS